MTFFFAFQFLGGGSQAPPPEHAPDVKALRLTNTVSLSEHIVLHYHSDASNRVYNHTHWEYRNKIVTIIFLAGACPGGGGQGACPPPPPLEIEKQKKRSSEQISGYSPILCYFFSRKYYLSAIF